MIKIGRPSPALVVAFLALAVALGGSAVALTGKGGRPKDLDFVRVKTNPVSDADPCDTQKAGIYCGHDSISGYRGFKNLGGEFLPVAFAKDSEGVVHLQGVAYVPGPPDGTTAFYLPKAYRPAATVEFPISFGQTNDCGGSTPEACPESVSLIRIRKSGEVGPEDGFGAEGFALDGITFAAK